MCQICIDWQKGKMNIQEARSNVSELLIDVDKLSNKELEHYFDLKEKLTEEYDETT